MGWAVEGIADESLFWHGAMEKPSVISEAWAGESASSVGV